MSLDPALRSRIGSLLQSNRVVLFMKGAPDAPQCGFSAKAVGVLNALLPQGYAHVNVLADAEIREGIKQYGNWPTIPQLYIDGELVGGSDIVEQMAGSGELHGVLGLPVPDRSPPQLTVTPAAVAPDFRKLRRVTLTRLSMVLMRVSSLGDGVWTALFGFGLLVLIRMWVSGSGHAAVAPPPCSRRGPGRRRSEPSARRRA